MSTSTKVIVILVCIIVAGLLWKIYSLTQERDTLYKSQQDGYESIIIDLNHQIQAAKDKNDSLQSSKNKEIDDAKKSTHQIKSNLNEKYRYADTVRIYIIDSILSSHYDSLARFRFGK